MKLRWSDWTRACLAAPVLLGLASLIVFEIPHGFEEQVGWYMVLLPGAFIAAPFSDTIARVFPHGESIVFLVVLACFNFVWYFVLSYTAILVYRFLSGTSRKS